MNTTNTDPDNDPCCPACGDQVPAGELVSLTGHPDLCGVCADDVVASAPVKELWDSAGAPRLPHVACPNCGEKEEVGSFFDDAWCCSLGCGWRGSLTAMRERAGGKVHRAAVQPPTRARGEFRWMSAGYESPERQRQREVIEGWGRRRAEAARLAAPPALGQHLAGATVVLVCLLALVGVLASWGAP